jgi:hypothetical protein
VAALMARFTTGGNKVVEFQWKGLLKTLNYDAIKKI